MTIEFIYKSPIVEESISKDYKAFEVTLLGEGVSGHKIEYICEETNFDYVAKTAVGKDIYYGQDIVGKHDAPPMKTEDGKTSGEFYSGRPSIGKIVRVWVDKKARKVKAIIHITDPILKDQIKPDWGISIRGVCDTLKPILTKAKTIFRAIRMRIHDINLFQPKQRRGMQTSKVEKVLSESMEFKTELYILEGDTDGVFIV